MNAGLRRPSAREWADVEARDDDGNTPLHIAAKHDRYGHAGDAIEALLDAGASPTARNAAGQTPWELASGNEELNGSDAYWRLNEARFDEPVQESRRPGSVQPRAAASREQQQAPPPQGRACEIPGYPAPNDVQTLGLGWCGSTVDFQRRVFALQAAGAWFAIGAGTSSTPEQVAARHQEITTLCDQLDALGARRRLITPTLSTGLRPARSAGKHPEAGL